MKYLFLALLLIGCGPADTTVYKQLKEINEHNNTNLRRMYDEIQSCDVLAKCAGFESGIIESSMPIAGSWSMSELNQFSFLFKCKMSRASTPEEIQAIKGRYKVVGGGDLPAGVYETQNREFELDQIGTALAGCKMAKCKEKECK